jgi:hypothetical protein
LQKYRSLLRYHNLFERAYTLEQCQTYPMSVDMIQEYEAIDNM